VVSTFINLVLYQWWVLNIILKINVALFLAWWTFKMVHEASLYSIRRNNDLWGNSSPSKINHNSNFNTLKVVQKFSTIHSTWSSYFKNPDSSADGESNSQFQMLWCCYLPVYVISHYANWTSLSPISYYHGFHRMKN